MRVGIIFLGLIASTVPLSEFSTAFVWCSGEVSKSTDHVGNMNGVALCTRANYNRLEKTNAFRGPARGQHGGMGVSTVAPQQESPGFKSAYLSGVYMFYP